MNSKVFRNDFKVSNYIKIKSEYPLIDRKILLLICGTKSKQRYPSNGFYLILKGKIENKILGS